MMPMRMVITLALFNVLAIPLSAQDDIKPTTVTDTSAAAIKNALPNHPARTVQELVDDTPVKPVEVTAQAIEPVLKETGMMIFRLKGHLILVPVVETVPVSDIALAISNAHSRTVMSDLQLHVGRTALILSSENGISGSFCLIQVLEAMFGDPNQQKVDVLPSTVKKSVIINGEEAKTVPASDKSLEQFLEQAETISVGLGAYIVILPLTDKSPRKKLAHAVLEVVEAQAQRRFPAIQLYDGGKDLFIMSPLLNAWTAIGILISALDDRPLPEGEFKPAPPFVESTPTVTTAAPDTPKQGASQIGSDPLSSESSKTDSSQADNLPLKIFVLKRSSATDIATILQQLFRDPNLKIVPDTRTNSVIVNGPENLQSAIEALTKKLDEEPAKASSPAASVLPRTAVGNKPLEAKLKRVAGVKSDDQLWRSNLSDAQAEARRLGRPLLIHFHAAWCVTCRRMDSEVLSTRDDMKRALTDRVVGVRIDIDQHPDIAEKYGIDAIPADLLLGPRGNLISRMVGFRPYHSYLAKIAHAETASAEGLQEKYRTAEQKAWELAQQLREDGSSNDKLKAKLREAVANAFSLRQEMHQAELGAFQQRIADLRQKIEAREKIKEQVIDHRIQELLDPNLKWKSSESSTPPLQATTAMTSVKNLEVNELEKQQRPVADNAPTELEGEWSLQSVTSPGQSPFTVGLRSRFRGNQWSMPAPGRPNFLRVAVNSQTEPKSLVVTIPQNSMPIVSKSLVAVWDQRVGPSTEMRARYRLEDDILSITFEAGPREEFVHTWKRVRDQKQIVTLYLTSVNGIGRVTPLKRDDTTSEAITKFSEVPGGYGLEVGTTHRLRLEDLPDHPGKELILSVEVPGLSAETYEYLSFYGLPLLIKDEDLNVQETGASYANILYVENLKSPELKECRVHLSGKQSTAEIDSVLADIRKQGTVVAIVRMTMRINAQTASVTTRSVVLKSDARLILKDAQEFQKQFHDLARQVQASRASLDHGRELLKTDKATQRIFDIKQKNYDDHLQQLKLLRAEYDTQIKLLTTEIQSLFRKRNELSRTPESSEMSEVLRRLEQAEILNELYHKIVIPPEAIGESIDPQTKESAPELPKSK